MSLVNKNAKKSQESTTPYTFSTQIKFEWWKYIIVATSTNTVRFFMAFIPKLIKKRISILISRFDVPKIPPHMVNQLGAEKEATSTN